MCDMQFQSAMYPDMDTIPDKVLEKAYWRRKLPPAFRFYLEMLCRDLMLSQPANPYQHAATFFEELLLQRDTELSLLPYRNYLEKLKDKKGYGSKVKTTCEATCPPKSPQPECIKCTRCGRTLNTLQAQQGPYPCGASGGGGGAASQYGGAYHGPGAPCRPPQRVPNCVDAGTRVVALPLTKDPFGKLIHRLCPRREDEELLSAQELSILLDY